MGTLTAEQRDRALEAMRSYLAAPKDSGGKTPAEVERECDERRANLIDAELKPLVVGYLAADVPLPGFKSRVDGLNKRNELWGFKGIKGQMFFNMLINVASDIGECDQEIKAAIDKPANEEIASSRIKTFHSYVRRIGDEHVDGGGSKQGRPKVGSIPFFLSYFWQIQDRDAWPVFYTNSVNTMIDLNLWQPTDDPAADYLAYKHLYEELAGLFTKEFGQPLGLYDVEHMFWFVGSNPYGESKSTNGDSSTNRTPRPTGGTEYIESNSRLPESYVPPIVAILPRMAKNEPGLEEAAKASGTSLVRAFEKSINAAFTMLGYDTKLLGQGQGRVPDGLAVDHDNSYAILWDAKIRQNGYSMGTDDRVIREYVTTQSRELKRRRPLRNIYYLIVSSGFHDDFDDLIRSLKMETDISEVCLLEAAGLVAMVDTKMRNPLQVTLGADGIQRLFSNGGIISPEDILQTLG